MLIIFGGFRFYIIVAFQFFPNSLQMQVNGQPHHLPLGVIVGQLAAQSERLTIEELAPVVADHFYGGSRRSICIGG